MNRVGDLDALLAKRRSPLFETALVNLLSAYDYDTQAAQLDMQAQATRSDQHAVADTGASAPPDNQKAAGQSCVETNGAAVRGTDSHQVDQQANGHSTNSVEAGTNAGTSRRKASNRSHEQHLKGLVGDTACCTKDPKAIAQGPAFEALSAGILLFFCLLTALEMQKQGLVVGFEVGWPYYRDPEDTIWPELGEYLEVLMYVCGALFAMEVSFRLVAERLDFWKDPWNYFDIAILVCWAVEIIGDFSVAGIQFMRSLRLMRLLRFIQLFRFINRLDALYFLIQAMKGSLRILGWCSVLLFAVQTLTAFVINQLLMMFYFPDKTHPLEERAKVFEYFGSYSRCLLTTFEMAMGNWPVPARVLFENVSEWYVILFIAHKVTVGLSVVGVINAVFVQETLQLATSDDVAMVLRKRRQARIMKEKLERLFKAADENGDGSVTQKEFEEVLEHDDVRTWLSSMDFDCKDPGHLFHLLDHDTDGNLNAREFFDGMTSLRGHARAMDLIHVIEEVHRLQEMSHNKVQENAAHKFFERSGTFSATANRRAS